MTKTKVSHKVVLHFPSRVVNQPVISNLIKHYDLSFNIMKASIIPDEEGFVVLELTGEPEKIRGRHQIPQRQRRQDRGAEPEHRTQRGAVFAVRRLRRLLPHRRLYA